MNEDGLACAGAFLAAALWTGLYFWLGEWQLLVPAALSAAFGAVSLKWAMTERTK